MHEAAIAMAIIDQAVAAAARHNATRICRIEVELGAMQQVVPEALDVAFEAAGKGTLAQDAQLKLTTVKTVALCRQCDCRFEPCIEHFSFLCPQCQQADVRIISGNQITLKSLECEQPEEADEANVS
jgi:hydrogenase nickel incorporation protein HypA/HybF